MPVCELSYKGRLVAGFRVTKFQVALPAGRVPDSDKTIVEDGAGYRYLRLIRPGQDTHTHIFTLL